MCCSPARPRASARLGRATYSTRRSQALEACGSGCAVRRMGESNRGSAPVAVEQIPRRAKRRRDWRKVLGPGLIAGASDDDPSGIATYSQAGAQLGFAISWTMLFSYPLMVAIQEISARIGRTTGRGIAANIRRHYPNWMLQTIVVLVLTANTINIGADIGAMGDAVKEL